MKYVIETEHEPEECMRALKELSESEKTNVLGKFVFACKSGEHVGWGYVDAENEEDALNNVPEFIRDKACAHEVEKFSQEQIKSIHEK